MNHCRGPESESPALALDPGSGAGNKCMAEFAPGSHDPEAHLKVKVVDTQSLVKVFATKAADTNLVSLL